MWATPVVDGDNDGDDVDENDSGHACVEPSRLHHLPQPPSQGTPCPARITPANKVMRRHTFPRQVSWSQRAQTCSGTPVPLAGLEPDNLQQKSTSKSNLQ